MIFSSLQNSSHAFPTQACSSKKDRAFPGIRTLLLLFLIAALCSIGWGQATSGTIFGRVTDSSGAMVPNAKVTAEARSIGVSRTVNTSETGDFVFPNMLPATYTIVVEAPGFKKLASSGVILSAADKLNAGDLTLQVGGTDTSVEVKADAGQIQLQSNSGERSELVTGKQINDLALNGRNVLDFLKVVPGVISGFNGQEAGTGGIDAFNINGTRANQHEFTIDGASNVDTGNNGGTHVTLNPDAIAEVKVLTSNYQAEFGKAAGGQVVVTTKSGTSQFHGDARFFHRNESLNANNWFNNLTNTPIAKYRYNYAGYQFGGPVLIPGTNFNKNRDKLYFFWGQEYYRQLIPGSVEHFRVPTALERQGDFSQTVDGNGHPLVIYNPATGLPFPGNKISGLTPDQQKTFDEVSKVLSLYDLPNVSGNNQYNFASQLSYDSPRREDILRLDYQLTTNNRFFGRWINNATEFTSPMQTWNLNCMGQLQYPGGCRAKNPSWNLSLNLVSTITPTLVNELSFGPSVTRSTWEGNNGNTSRGANNIDLPMLFPVTAETNVPDFSFSGNDNISYPWSYLGANPWFQANTTINFTDNLTKVLGNHTLKFGIFGQRARKDQIAWGNSNGQISFSNCATSADPSGCPNSSGNAYASALLGDFTSFSQTSSRPIGYFRYTNLEFYGQDTWKVTPRLTLDYGMRFAWYQPQYDTKNQLAIFDPASYDPAKAVRLYKPAVGGGAYDPANPGVVLDGSLVGTIVPGSGDLTNGVRFASDGYDRGGWDDRGIMPEPRLGFAYQLTGDQKTVLRGGFGMLHDRIQGNLIFNPVFNNPANVTTPTITNGNIADIQSLSADSTPILSGIIGAERSGKVPTVYNYSLGIQREVGLGTTVDVSYVGSVSRHLVTARNVNQIPYLTAFTAAAQDPSKYSTGVVPAVEPDLPTAYSAAGFSYSGNYAYDAPFLVPYQGYGAIEYYKFDGTANYNSLQVSVQRRFGRGLTFGAAYTFSKTLTTANRDEDQQDTFDPRKYDYRLAEWDRPHVLVFNYVYDLPSVTKRFNGPKWLGYVTDNFQLSGITSFESGAPVDTGIWWPPSWTINGTYNAWWTGWTRAYVYPTIVGDVNKSVGTSKFNPAAFQAPPIGLPVRPSRSNIRGGGLQNWDMSLFKNIPLGNEQRYIQLRLEAFNVFNHPNFDNVNLNWNLNTPSGTSPMTLVPVTRPAGDTSLPGSYFGEYNHQYGGTGGPRVVQLGAKFYF
ncbi:MAG: carboxypeptidase regulatory-like domain-containing protein [Acidobacteriaceae bacterium]